MADPTRQQQHTSNSSTTSADDDPSQSPKTPAADGQSDEEMEMAWWMKIPLLMAVWMALALVGTPVFGWGASVFIVSPAIILLLVGVTAFTDVNSGAMVGFSILCIIFLVAFTVLIYARGILWYAVGIPFVSLGEYAMTVPYVTSAVVLGVVAIIVSAVLYTIWKTETPVNWSLLVLMVVCPLVLGALLIGFFTAIWRIIEAIVLFGLGLLGIGTDAHLLVTGAVVFGLVAVFVYLELAQLASTGRLENATVVTAEEAPTLHTVTTRVASQLDIPIPEIAVAKRPEPEAITRGYRPGSVTLIVSQGTLDALDEERLEAVVAHELAHAANMDAIVMTVVSLPALLSDNLSDRLHKWTFEDEPDGHRETIGGSGDDDGEDGRFSGVARVFAFVRKLIQKIIRGVRRTVSSLPQPVLKYAALLLVPIVALVGLTLSKVQRESQHYVVVYVLLLIALLTEYLSRPIVAVLARTRESAADRTAATVTGSPAVLAAALQTLDERITETPSTDSREASSLSSLSILPLNPINTNPNTDDHVGFTGFVVDLIIPEHDQEATNVERTIAETLLWLRWRLFATHPPINHRLDALAALEENRK